MSSACADRMIVGVCSVSFGARLTCRLWFHLCRNWFHTGLSLPHFIMDLVQWTDTSSWIPPKVWDELWDLGQILQDVPSVKIVSTGVPRAVKLWKVALLWLPEQTVQLFAKGGVSQCQSVAWHSWCLYVFPQVVKALLAVSIWLAVCHPEVEYEMCGTPGKKREGNDCLEDHSKVETFKTGSCQNRICILELCLKLLALGQWRVEKVPASCFLFAQRLITGSNWDSFYKGSSGKSP